jgi:glycosyltransferase involved in cell wall biosynthesis
VTAVHVSKQVWRAGLPASVDICIPFFKDDPTALIRELAHQTDAGSFRLSLCDDGTADPGLTARVQAALAAFPGPAVMHSLAQNTGRANARNVMLQNLLADWVLLLDADMALDTPEFVVTYRDAAAHFTAPCCIVGGFRVDRADIRPATRLHAAQSLKSECKPASERALDPGRYVYSSSVFVHRMVVEQHLFDPEFQAWGWEDVEWGWRIMRDNPVHHIDNPARHVGLDADAALVAKYTESVGNFSRIKRLYPTEVARMPIARVANLLSYMPFKHALSDLFKAITLFGPLPVTLRLYALKFYRASLYAKAYHDR